MKIGELARRTACLPETIRYYERQGLLPAAARTEANYRLYGIEHEALLRFILHCRSLDMASGEIRTLLQLKSSAAGNCGQVNEVLDAHIGHVRQRIGELRQLEQQLHDLRAQCQTVAEPADCEILHRLSAAGDTTRRSDAGAVAHVHGTHKSSHF